MDDLVGPAIVLSITKPDGVPELSSDQILPFIEKILNKECGRIDHKPTTSHVFNPALTVNHYQWRGIKRVSWGYTAHCVRT